MVASEDFREIWCAGRGSMLDSELAGKSERGSVTERADLFV